MGTKRQFTATKPTKDMGDFEEWAQQIAELLQNEPRWKERAEFGPTAYHENVLQHILKHNLLTAWMYGLEEDKGDLDLALLLSGGCVHDFGEGLSTDKSDVLKTDADDEEEESAYDFLTRPLPSEAKDIFDEGYKLANAKPKTTKNELFFRSVEIVGYLMRALNEVRHGNAHFTEVFFRRQKDIAFFLPMFSSFRALTEPLIPEMRDYMLKHLEWNPFK